MPPNTEQSQMINTESASTNQNQPAIMQSSVQYTAGKFINAPSGYGLLEWAADGHIKLFEIDPQTQQSKGVLFNIVPSDIKKITTSLAMLNLKTQDKFFGLEFSQSATPWLMAGGVLGLAMSHKKTKESGIKWWVENLKKQGVKVTDFNLSGKAGKFLIIGILAVAFILAIAMAVPSY